MESPDSGVMQTPYEPPISLWQLVEKHVSSNEWEEVKRILGESLVDQSLELHQEIQTLLEIWQDYRAETDQLFTHHRLPEPPAARDRLKQEILFFVESLKQKAEENGRNPDHVTAKHDSGVIKYVLDDSRPGSQCSSRPCSAAGSRSGRETPMTARSSTMDHHRVAKTLSKDLQNLDERLTSLNMDDVAQHLRETLEEEVQMLLQDIEFLQQCLDDEADFRSNTQSSREPTLQDLREERAKLERDLLSPEPAIPHIKPRTGSAQKSSLRLKTSQSPLATKSGPLKASHNLSHGALPKAPSSDLKTPHSQLLNEQFKPGSAHRSHRIAPETTHVTIRTAKPANPASMVRKGSASSKVGPEEPVLVPSPPSSAKPGSGRPNSASRFRKMVLECRDDT